jgi:hypothetical protein
MIYESREPRWNYIDRENPKKAEINLSQWHLCTDLVANQDLRGKRPATNLLSHGTA